MSRTNVEQAEETMRIFVLVSILAFAHLVASSKSVEAHSGGLNSQGCHAGSRPYHCHRSSSEMVGNRLRCDLGSKSTECKNRSSPNSNDMSEDEIEAFLDSHRPISNSERVDKFLRQYRHLFD